MTENAHPRLIEGRDIAAAQGPRPLAIIGAQHANQVGFATVAWTTPLSHNPPLAAFALREKSHTFGLLRQSGTFSLSLLDGLDDEAAQLAAYCGNTSGNREDKAARVPHALVNFDDERQLVAPVPDAALTTLFCQVQDIREAGDHQLVIGQVLRAQTRCGTDGKGRIDPTNALLCVQHDLFACVNDEGDILA